MNLKKIKYLFIAIFLAINFQISSFSAEKEINCLAKIVYFEARGEPLKGKRMVAATVMNRVNSESFPDNICSNMLAANQFSFMKGHLKITDIKAYRESEKIAKDIIYNGHSYPKNMLYFTHTNIKPRWTKKLKVFKIAGKHIFYQQN